MWKPCKHASNKENGWMPYFVYASPIYCKIVETYEHLVLRVKHGRISYLVCGCHYQWQEVFCFKKNWGQKVNMLKLENMISQAEMDFICRCPHSQYKKCYLRSASHLSVGAWYNIWSRKSSNALPAGFFRKLINYVLENLNAFCVLFVLVHYFFTGPFFLNLDKNWKDFPFFMKFLWQQSVGL